MTSISSISDPDNLIIPGTMYGFTGGYVEASELEPGQGYWIRSSGAGSITISSGMQEKSREFTNHLEGANFLKINGQTLYFGMDVPEEHKLSYSLPPKPPVGAKDIRFSGDTKLCATDECVIEVMNNGNPLTFEFDIKDGDVWEITDESGNVFECSGVNVLEVNGDSEKWRLRKFRTTVPTIFALHTAYPNPFNPVTTIQFSVQTHGNASLQIYDITGKLVETLVDEFLEPGNHSVQWNASNFSSGIYFYNFTTPEFNVNVCQLPFWALTVYYSWSSYKKNNINSWILFGVFAALGFLSKYLFIYLLIGIKIFFGYIIIKKKKFHYLA